MPVRLLSSLVGSGILLVAGAAHSADYAFTGKFTSSRGKLINIPLIGNTPCAPLTIRSGPGNGGANTYDARRIARPANTWGGRSYSGYFVPGPDLLCVKHAAGKKLATDGDRTPMGKGGGFVMPPQAFSKPLPPYVRAVEVKYAPPIEQLATSFHVTGPPATRVDPVGGTMANGTNTAAFRVFKKDAWKTQTGRAGAMFTWCPASPVSAGMGAPCTNIGQAGPNLIVKYQGGVNAFGGTMAYIVSSGPNTSSLAIGLGEGPVAFQILSGMGSQATGRGYADFRVTPLKGGPIYANHERKTGDDGGLAGRQKLITMVTGRVGQFPDGTNFNFGFPLTTGTVLVRNYLTRTTTLTAKGGDVITSMGARNLSLVAGGVAVANLGGGASSQNTPEILSLMLPEPAARMQLLAGITAVVGIAAARRRRRIRARARA